MMTAAEIIAAMERHHREHPASPRYFGLRCDARAYEADDILPASRVWDDGEPTAEMLEGTSSLGLSLGDSEQQVERVIAEMTEFYARRGEHIYLIAGDEMSIGYDRSTCERVYEAILTEAWVLEVVR